MLLCPEDALLSLPRRATPGPVVIPPLQASAPGPEDALLHIERLCVHFVSTGVPKKCSGLTGMHGL